MKIIVTGSLGNISKPLAEELIQKGHNITVISSKAEKQKDIETLGATAAIGSLNDADFLTATFTGADAVYAMVPPNLGVSDSRAYYREIGNAYAQAVKASGVKRVVHLSSIGADLDKGTGFILGSHDVEGILNELNDVNLTHLRPGYFYLNLYGFTDMIKGMGIIGTNYGGDDKMVMVHPTDISLAAAEELQASPGQKMRYVVSDVRTANETAQIIGKAIGKPDLKWLAFTNEQMADGMEKSGVPAHVIPNFVEMGASMHSGILYKDYEAHNPASMGKVKIEDFAKEFASAF
ncbi:NAD(P)H-binding protein [Mucilaginibacter agri]|uniref:NAD(P)H-binding protein n=1 Tax=Mucilaginibacter agri TaxID=2695265 RepID=A0A965ZGS1_9SPHI|nr:NAD(P)H-binding protein [Mucilaginibacter agri]NCD70773.1 NAD(P)H-binding protein [Mucilaginibacter agri]